MDQKEAANLPIEVRVAGYAADHNLEAKDALLQLAEWGLQKYLEDQMIYNDVDWQPPIYLWASYQRLGAHFEAETGHKPGG